MKAQYNAAMSAAVLLVLSACSRESNETAAVQEPATPAAIEPQVSNLQLGERTDTAAGTTAQLAPGEPINVSMQVTGVTPDTPVTVHWYGPNDQPLAYETQNVTPGQEQLNFTHDNTHDWTAGEYRAEVWVNGRKLEEESFQIAAGGMTAATDQG